MATSDRDALLAAILAQPEEDTLRLVYADWLQENGQADRAEFIRRQVEAVRAEPDSPQTRAAADAARKLLDRHAGEWTRAVRTRAFGWKFDRGFIEHLEMHAAAFPRVAAELFATEPIRSLAVMREHSEENPVPLAPLFGTPQLSRLSRLDVSELRLSPDDFPALSECPHLGNLTDLCMRDTPVPPSWLAALLAGPSMPRLVGLDLKGAAHLGPMLASTLPRIEHRRFTRLDLSRVRFGSSEMQRVLESRCLREVEELRLGWWLTGTSYDGVLTHLDLGWVIPWDRLRLLDLSGQGVGNNGVAEIVLELTRRRDSAALRHLDLRNNHVGRDGVRALVTSPLTLYYLDLRGNYDLTDSHKAALESRFPDAVVKLRD